MDLMKIVEQPYIKEKLPLFRVGDNVDVHVKIVEGDKERIQVFSGTVIARKGSGINEKFLVRRIVAGEGVERSFPMHAPSVTQVKVTRRGRVRRAKLYYLRDRVGKAVKVRELIGGELEAADTEAGAEAAAEAEKKAKKRGKKVKEEGSKAEADKAAAEREKARKAKKDSRKAAKKAKDKPQAGAEAPSA